MMCQTTWRRLAGRAAAVGVIALLATTAAPAAAQPAPLIGDQPAATLLLPYFEVDLENPGGANTLFSVNNASASAALVHVTVWSTMHVPVYGFDVYLTGYDMQTINVRDILNGVLPMTASDGQDPLDDSSPTTGISNQGILSQDINFASCAAAGPGDPNALPPAPVPQAVLDHVRASLTGQPSPLTGTCASIPDGTRIARGYITVDDTTQCTSLSPRDPGYFTGVAGSRNLLWGDVVYVNHLPGQEASDGSPLVHIRAIPGGGIGNVYAPEADTTVSGQYTFYGRLVNWTAIDNREPLATTFLSRFSSGGAFPATTLTVWRDAKVDQQAFTCGTTPSWYPLSQASIGIFDEQEQVEVAASVPFAPQVDSTVLRPFPAGAQRVRIGGSELPTTKTYGFVYLNLNTAVAGSPNPPENAAAAQAWVSVHMKGRGLYGVGWHATQLDTARDTYNMVLPIH